MSSIATSSDSKSELILHRVNHEDPNYKHYYFDYKVPSSTANIKGHVDLKDYSPTIGLTVVGILQQICRDNFTASACPIYGVKIVRNPKTIDADHVGKAQIIFYFRNNGTAGRNLFLQKFAVALHSQRGLSFSDPREDLVGIGSLAFFAELKEAKGLSLRCSNDAVDICYYNADKLLYEMLCSLLKYKKKEDEENEGEEAEYQDGVAECIAGFPKEITDFLATIPEEKSYSGINKIIRQTKRLLETYAYSPEIVEDILGKMRVFLKRTIIKQRIDTNKTQLAKMLGSEAVVKEADAKKTALVGAGERT